MACSQRAVFKHFIKLINKRNISMSTQLRAKELLDNMKEKNPYYDKYADKIAALQQTSPGEFVERMEKCDQKKAPKKEAGRNYSELLRPKEALDQPAGEVASKKLSDIMKIDLIEDKSAEEIKKLWFEHHKTKDVIAAVIPVEQYELLITRGKMYPVFLFPLPRNEGYEFIMLQFCANTVHFTPLLCYQVHKENAPECLNVVHYPELKDKGIVLMRGEYDKQVLNGPEAQCLANQLQLYYCQNDKSKLELLQRFTNQPDSFKHMDLIKDLENINLK